MKTLLLILATMQLCSCSVLSKGSPEEGKSSYSYADVTGQYQFKREKKQFKNKSVTRTVLLSPGGGGKIVEKSVTVAQLGSIKGQNGRVIVMRPMASEFVVWLEGKKYESKMKINPKAKSMVVTLNSPEEKWKGTREIPFPEGKLFCFFSQIPECLYHTQLLNMALENPHQELGFYVVWDSFPYTEEQYTEAGKDLFAPAMLKFETDDRGLLRFLVEVNGQIILYHFSKSFNLVKMSWIAQGITVVPFGEVIDSIDE